MNDRASVQARVRLERRILSDQEHVRQDRNDTAHHFGDMERQIEGWREQRAFTATGRSILTALGIPATGPLTDAHRTTIAARMREQGLTIAE